MNNKITKEEMWTTLLFIRDSEMGAYININLFWGNKKKKKKKKKKKLLRVSSPR